ncbi:class I SAM-dependent methyltransferase [Nocardioides sp. 1609]|uniref:class I SAM-dependent methyltransferase n=1 Tax=Nocardioides sp. 1609 TaxID=2508327 RepID=UPI00106F750D|nr:class I SAM-dependent methyltransferase [Nocardioides sp. 1609]
MNSADRRTTSHPGHAHGHDHGHGAGLVRLLELDAIVMQSFLAEATEWVGSITDARRVADVGSGIGASTVALAETFPESSVVAIDVSVEMLAKVRERAARHGLDKRVAAVQVDIEQPWPDLGLFDVIWASSVLHEVDADAVLGRLALALEDEGVLIVVEMDTPPTFLPDPTLEKRIHAFLRRLPSGQAAHPDWTEHLERTGFAITERRTFVVDQVPDDQRSTAEFARRYLERVRPYVSDLLVAADLEALDALLQPDGPTSLEQLEGRLRVRGSRTAWSARRA